MEATGVEPVGMEWQALARRTCCPQTLLWPRRAQAYRGHYSPEPELDRASDYVVRAMRHIALSPWLKPPTVPGRSAAAR